MQNEPAETATRKQRWNVAAIGYTFLPIVLALRHINSAPDLRTYGPSHWFLNYHHGFVRRALVGQALAHFAFLSWRKIFVIEAVVLLCAIVFTYVALRSTLFGNLDERRLAAFLLAAPAFLPPMWYMAGEMDNFLYIALILAAWMLMRFRNNLGLLAATVLTFIGLAIHEAFLLMFYPLLIAFLVELLYRKRLKPLWIALHCISVAVFFLLILAVGKPRETQAAWVVQAQQRTDMPIESTVFMALHNTLAEQVHFVMGRYTHLLLRGIVITLVLCIPYGIVLWKLLRGTVQSRGYTPALTRVVLLLFCLPLLLIPLGHDAMRWTAALCIDVSLYVLFIYQADQAIPERKATSCAALRRWNANPANAATFLYLLALGPWGLAGNRFFSNFSNLFKK